MRPLPLPFLLFSLFFLADRIVYSCGMRSKIAAAASSPAAVSLMQCCIRTYIMAAAAAAG